MNRMQEALEKAIKAQVKLLNIKETLRTPQQLKTETKEGKPSPVAIDKV